MKSYFALSFALSFAMRRFDKRLIETMSEVVGEAYLLGMNQLASQLWVKRFTPHCSFAKLGIAAASRCFFARWS